MVECMFTVTPMPGGFGGVGGGGDIDAQARLQHAVDEGLINNGRHVT